jgi:Zn finger protein HypA/HybF involved in hydrogenase expression
LTPVKPTDAKSVNNRKLLMAEGYCVKCKARKEIVDAVEETMKNGRKAIKGKCPTCGTVMFKILGGKAGAPATAPVEPASPKPAT